MTANPLDAWEGEGGSVVEPPEVPQCELAWGVEPAPSIVYEAPRCAPELVRHISVGFRPSPPMAWLDRAALACLRWLLAFLAIPLEWTAARRRKRRGASPRIRIDADAVWSLPPLNVERALQEHLLWTSRAERLGGAVVGEGGHLP